MTTHILHPGSLENGLCDDCPRCAEHTRNPAASLDAENIRRLLAGHIFTQYDAIAAGKLRALRREELESLGVEP